MINFLQPQKAKLRISVHEGGTKVEVRDLHPLNVANPMYSDDLRPYLNTFIGTDSGRAPFVMR